MRNLLTWFWRWLSAGEQAMVVPVDYVVEADVEVRFVASADVEMRVTASEDVEL